MKKERDDFLILYHIVRRSKGLPNTAELFGNANEIYTILHFHMSSRLLKFVLLKCVLQKVWENSLTENHLKWRMWEQWEEQADQQLFWSWCLLHSWVPVPHHPHHMLVLSYMIRFAINQKTCQQNPNMLPRFLTLWAAKWTIWCNCFRFGSLNHT